MNIAISIGTAAIANRPPIRRIQFAASAVSIGANLGVESDSAIAPARLSAAGSPRNHSAASEANSSAAEVRSWLLTT